VQHRFLDTLTGSLDVAEGPSFAEIRDEDSLAVVPGCAYGDFSDTFSS
jgi:hypothetical protein